MYLFFSLLYLLQITISSGGMYTEKLDPDDLNLTQRKDNFVGTFAYGQNKVSKWQNDVLPFSSCLPSSFIFFLPLATADSYVQKVG